MTWRPPLPTPVPSAPPPGTSAGSLDKTADADTRTYSKQDIKDACGWGNRTLPGDANLVSVSKGWLAPGSLHLATLTGLLPATTYYYKVLDNVSEDSGGRGPRRRFCWRRLRV